MKITEHWSNHILHANINDDEYTDLLSMHILCNIPFTHRDPYFNDEVLLEDFHKEDAVFVKYKEYVRQYVDQYIKQVFDLDDLDYYVKTFLVTNEIHTRTTLHNHQGAFISGVVYINVDEDSGALIMHDPRFNACRSQPPEITKMFQPVEILPKSGDIIIFPSFVYHETHISKSSVPRILIPFDVYPKFN